VLLGIRRSLWAHRWGGGGWNLPWDGTSQLGYAKKTYICSAKRDLYLLCQKRPIFALPKETYICSAKRDLYLAHLNHHNLICLGWQISPWICQKRPIFALKETCCDMFRVREWECLEMFQIRESECGRVLNHHLDMPKETYMCFKRNMFSSASEGVPLRWMTSALNGVRVYKTRLFYSKYRSLFALLVSTLCI